MKVEVRAPATVANLGPGFDCLGAALSLELRLRAAPAPRASWDPGGEPDPGPDLVLRAARAVAGELPPLRLRVLARIPVGRGLGSSAAAVVAGLLLGCALAGRRPEPWELLRLGLPLEGHPDNLAPCLVGGLCLVVPGGEVLRFTPTRAVRPVLLVPGAGLATAEARRALPDTVALGDAVANVARAAGLVALLTGLLEATPERLLACTEDLLHQPYRAKLYPETARALAALRAQGVPAVVAGAGPAVLCLVVGGERPELPGWERVEAGWQRRGARMRVSTDG